LAALSVRSVASAAAGFFANTIISSKKELEFLTRPNSPIPVQAEALASVAANANAAAALAENQR
jgi:hypothetical protein